MEPILFQSLRAEEKVNFFVRCQEILKNHHPESPFAFTTINFNDRKNYFKGFYEKYQGFAYTDENVCILFNKIILKDARNPIEAVKENQWKGPKENYNAFMIDFATFSSVEQCLPFIKANYVPQIKYALYARHQDIKIYPVEKLILSLSKNKLNI